jgi:flagellin
MISINTNLSASVASYNLIKSNASVQRSLNRLSSGFRTNCSYDDAGGMAVSMKLSASIRRTEATATGISNAISYLETQDGVLKLAGNVLTRMAELATLAQDVTKSTDDLANYDLEYQSLIDQLASLDTETFNAIGLVDGSALTVVTSEDGTQTYDLGGGTGGTPVDLDGVITSTLTGDLLSTANAATEQVLITTAITELGLMRATNGADQSRLTFAGDLLAVNKTNLEAANSRIIDVDVAAESTQLARFNILQQSGTAMLAQANQSSQSILRLLV